MTGYEGTDEAGDGGDGLEQHSVGVVPAVQGTRSASLIHTEMASGTHVLAVAVASWVATARCRTNPALRTAVTVASTVHAGLFLVFPLRQIALGFGWRSAASSILAVSAPLFAGWVLYAIAASSLGEKP